MKIIYIHQYFTMPDTSGNTRSYDLAMSFVNSGHQVEFLTTSCNIAGDFNKGWNTLNLDQDIKIHVLKTRKYDNSLSTLARIQFFLYFLSQCSIKILRLRADLTIATSTPLTVGIPALINLWFGKTPYIFEVRDVWPEAVIAIGAIKNKLVISGLLYLEKLIYKNAAYIVALSSDMRKSIVSRFPDMNKKIKVIENLSVIERFAVSESWVDQVSAAPYRTSRFKILYAGAFGKVNNIAYVVDFAARLLPVDASISFILIGNGAEKEAVRKKAQDLGVLNKNVFILDPVSKNELPQLYYNTEMGSSFVAPIKELWSNSANKFFDSLAAGKPVLINYKGWQSKVIESENIGYVLPYKLDSMTTEDLQEFINYTHNHALIEQQKKNAKKIAGNYSLKTASAKYLDLIHDLLYRVAPLSKHKH